MQVRQKAFQATSFLTYWLRALSEHSLHPPFIYKLYTEAIKKDLQGPEFMEIEKAREELLRNNGTIKISDLGAGSSVTGNKKRSIRRIARNSLTKARFSRLLYRLIRHMEATTVLELGTSLGINTLYLASATNGGQVYTLEGCTQTANIARQTFSKWPQSNIYLLEGDIDHTLPELLGEKLSKIDAAYLDANHTYEASLRYFNLLLPRLHKDSFLVMDDIYWSKGMKKAWKEIREHSSVSLSIDLFHAGILFFQPGIQKEHYILEY